MDKEAKPGLSSFKVIIKVTQLHLEILFLFLMFQQNAPPGVDL